MKKYSLEFYKLRQTQFPSSLEVFEVLEVWMGSEWSPKDLDEYKGEKEPVSPRVKVQTSDRNHGIGPGPQE